MVHAGCEGGNVTSGRDPSWQMKPCRARTWRWGPWLAVAVACLSGAVAQPHEPQVNDVNPNNGPTGGGTIITISGQNFGGGSSSVQPSITVGGVPCPQVVWVSATSVLCETPQGVGGHKAVLVDVDGATSVKNSNSEFQYDAPSVIAIEPGHGSAAGGTMVTVIGSNFGTSNNNPSVTIGGRPCQSVVWLSNSKLQCVSPPGIGIGDVRVFVLDLSSPENFGTIFEFDAPAIESLEPNHGPSTGGFYITVHGTNFGARPARAPLRATPSASPSRPPPLVLSGHAASLTPY